LSVGLWGYRFANTVVDMSESTKEVNDFKGISFSSVRFDRNSFILFDSAYQYSNVQIRTKYFKLKGDLEFDTSAKLEAQDRIQSTLQYRESR